jgi:hypothetical protein
MDQALMDQALMDQALLEQVLMDQALMDQAPMDQAPMDQALMDQGVLVRDYLKYPVEVCSIHHHTDVQHSFDHCSMDTKWHCQCHVQ